MRPALPAAFGEITILLQSSMTLVVLMDAVMKIGKRSGWMT